jgi:hypothetical protein
VEEIAPVNKIAGIGWIAVTITAFLAVAAVAARSAGPMQSVILPQVIVV